MLYLTRVAGSARAQSSAVAPPVCPLAALVCPLAPPVFPVAALVCPADADVVRSTTNRSTDVRSIDAWLTDPHRGPSLGREEPHEHRVLY
jgi:hypothetical protein